MKGRERKEIEKEESGEEEKCKFIKKSRSLIMPQEIRRGLVPQSV